MENKVAKKLFTLKKGINFVVNLEVSNCLGHCIFQRIDGKEDVYTENAPLFNNICSVKDAIIWQPVEQNQPVLELVLEVERNNKVTIESLNFTLSSHYHIIGFDDQETLNDLYAKEEGVYKFGHLIGEFRKSYTIIYVSGLSPDEPWTPASEHESLCQLAGTIDMELFDKCEIPFNRTRKYTPYQI